MTNLQIIKQIEQKLGVELERNDKIEWNTRNYIFNEKNEVSKLSLYNCKIKDLGRIIEFLKELKSLTSLYLRDNEISDISFLKDLKRLRGLDLSDNNISELPYNVFNNLKNIENWDDVLTNNPMKNPPFEILEKGRNAVKNYLEQLIIGNVEYLFETKLLIIGEGGAGKTSFAVKIKDKTAELPKDKDTTLGIEVTKWDFEVMHHLRGKQTMYANLWDFGGQKLYHGTHQIFFSKKSFYVLIDDTREERTDFAYWLNTIEQLAGEDSKLLIVINKKHEHVPQIDKNGLKGRFGNLITDFVTVDLKNDSNRIVKLQNKLKYLLPELPGIGNPLPASWVNIRKDLFNLKDKFISYDHYFKICKKNKTDTKKLDYLSDYFNRIGVFTHYYDDKILKNRIYLNSNWLVNTVYEVLNHKIVKENKGRLSETQIKEIWYSDKMFAEIDNLSHLMHRFGLMYEIDNTKKYVVPAHLPAEQPYKAWHHENKIGILQFAYEFDKYMPRGIMPRIIVALHRRIQNQKLVWSRGVNIEFENTQAEIKETYDKSNKFLIRIYGSRKKELLGIINNEFDKLLSPYKKLNYEKLVPCICNECKNQKEPHFFEYSELMRRKEKGIREKQCDKSYKDVIVTELLNGVTDIKTNFLEEEKYSSQLENKVLKLNGKDKKQLEKAIIAAYPKYSNLERFLDYELDLTLPEIVGNVKNIKDVVYELIKWTIRNNKIQELIEKAKADSKNHLIQ